MPGDYGIGVVSAESRWHPGRVTCDSPHVGTAGQRYDEVVATLRAAGCVYAEDEAALILAEDGDVDVLVARRVAGEPLEWVLGWAEFADLQLVVRPGVFVPRRRTELLAAQAIARLRPAFGKCVAANPVPSQPR